MARTYMATLELGNDPPKGWGVLLRDQARALGITCEFAGSQPGTVQLKVTVGKSRRRDADPIVRAFFDAAILSLRNESQPARAVDVKDTYSPDDKFLWIVCPLGGLGGGILAYFNDPAKFDTIGVFVISVIFTFGWMIVVGAVGGLADWIISRPRTRTLAELDAGPDGLINIGATPAVGPATHDVARAALRQRTTTMRRDLSTLWGSSRVIYWFAGLFFLAALAAPIGAGWLAHVHNDWHFLLAALWLSAVPLACGLALLRSERHLPTQYQEAAVEIAKLTRIELALDYAPVASTDTYKTTLHRVVDGLLAPKFANTASPS